MMHFFFDLDGTLADSEPGIIASFKAGMAACDAPPLAEAELRRFLGTPLPLFFRAVQPDIGAAGIAAGIAAFRDHFIRSGISQNRLYAGVKSMLRQVRSEGGDAWIVTSKPEGQALRVREMLGIGGLTSGVIGAGLAETDTKTELVARALARSGANARDALMLGDRHYDVTGALENGVHPVGALWGYGSREELAEAGCRDFADDAAEFTRRFVATHAMAAE